MGKGSISSKKKEKVVQAKSVVSKPTSFTIFQYHVPHTSTHHSPLTTHHSPFTTHHSTLNTHLSPPHAPGVGVTSLLLVSFLLKKLLLIGPLLFGLSDSPATSL